MSDQDTSVTLSPSLIFLVLFLCEAALLTVDLGNYFYDWVQSSEMHKLLDITLESNLPTWYSSTQELLVALFAYIVYTARRQQGAGVITSLAWLGIALFFFYIAVDDTSRIHERLGTVMHHSAEDTKAGGIWEVLRDFHSYTWQILFMPFFASVGVLMTIFLYREFGSRRLFIYFGAGITCYAIAVGLDYLDGLRHTYDAMMVQTDLSKDELRHLSRAYEEFLEMFGTTLILVSFLRHWAAMPESAHRLTIRFRGR